MFKTKPQKVVSKGIKPYNLKNQSKNVKVEEKKVKFKPKIRAIGKIVEEVKERSGFLGEFKAEL